jgi:hypothetical protein
MPVQWRTGTVAQQEPRLRTGPRPTAAPSMTPCWHAGVPASAPSHVTALQVLAGTAPLATQGAALQQDPGPAATRALGP